MKKVKQVKLTSELLRKIIMDEAAKFGKMSDTEDAANDAEETDADEFADSLENKIDYVKALKIEESRLEKRLAKIRESKNKAKAEILKKI